MPLMGDPTDPLPRVKASPACLSQWQLSRWAMSLAGSDEAQHFAAHLQTCDACRARRQAEDAAFAAAQSALLPAGLRVKPTPRWRFALLPLSGLGLGLALCTVLAAAVWLLPRQAPQPDILLKGEAILQVAVRRDGVVREGSWQEVGPAKPGDQVRFKVPSGAPTWQRLTVRRDSGWSTLFVGEVPANDWLPLGLTVNDQAPSALRLLVCPAPPAALAPNADAPADNSGIPPGCSVYDTRL